MRDAYRLARQKGWTLVGVACAKATQYHLFPVDGINIVGTDWGDESEFFTNYAIESGHPFGLINVAGGDQAKREMELIREAGGFVLHYPLTRV